MTTHAGACAARELAVPLVNLNGTSREALLAVHRTALRSLCTARNDLAQTAPHGRDFQTAAPGTFELACTQHRGRMAALSSVIAQVEATALALPPETGPGPRAGGRVA